jgi:flavorubredoxin
VRPSRTEVGRRAVERNDHSSDAEENPMTVTDIQFGTNLHEVVDGIYRINTPVVIEGSSGFSLNQYLIVDDESVLFS